VLLETGNRQTQTPLLGCSSEGVDYAEATAGEVEYDRLDAPAFHVGDDVQAQRRVGAFAAT